MIYYLGLGSNLGNRWESLRKALEALKKIGNVLIVSSVYETSPVGMADAEDFYNLVVKLDSQLEPTQLLARVKGIEACMGRDFIHGHYQPRVIDIDILLADDLVMANDCLQIPHPEMEKRAFVLVPLLEIAPELVHPVKGIRLRDFLAGIPPAQEVRRMEPKEFS